MDGTLSFRTAHLLRLQSVTRRRRMVPVGPNLRRAVTIRELSSLVTQTRVFLQPL